MNGTLKRTKVQHGLKTAKTPIVEGQRIQYNFVKPHMVLEGKTPAEVAGLGVKGWKKLRTSALLTKAENFSQSGKSREPQHPSQPRSSPHSSTMHFKDGIAFLETKQNI